MPCSRRHKNFPDDNLNAWLMKGFFSSSTHCLSCFLLGLLFILNNQAAWAQNPTVYYSNSVAAVDEPCVGSGPVKVGCAAVGNAANAASSSITSYATLKTPLLLSSVVIRLGMSGVVPKNSRAGIVISSDGTAIDLNLLGAIEIRTFKSKVQQQQQLIAADLLTATGALQSTRPTRLDFIATADFDQLEVRVGGLLSVSKTIRLYYAFGIQDNTSTTQYKGVLSDNTEPKKGTDYSTDTKDPNGAICVNAGVQNPQHAADADLGNYALLSSLVGVSCPSSLQVKLQNPAGANYQAGFVLGSGSVLDVSLLEKLEIKTYLGGVEQQSATGASLLQLQLLPDGKTQVSFPASLPFDRVEIRQNSLLSVLPDLQVYYGFGIEQNAFRDTSPVVSSFTNTANNVQSYANGVLCVDVGNTSCGGIRNAANAASSDLNSYAELSPVAGVLTTNRLKLRLNDNGLAGNLAGVVLSKGAGLLDASLLSNITINTYSGINGETLMESASGSSLLDLGLLAGGAKNSVGFRTTQPFSWVEIQVAQTVSVLDQLRIYNAFAEDTRMGFPTNLVAPSNPLPVELTAFAVHTTPQGAELRWQTASELNNSLFVVERAVQQGAEALFQPIGRVAGHGTSTVARQYRFVDATAAGLGVGTVYYRLRQVDFSGKETTSPVVAASFAGPALAASLRVAPNPAAGTDLVRVSVEAAGSGAGQQVAVYDAQGRQVSVLALTNQTALLPTKTLGQGLYHVVLLGAAGQRLTSQRLLIAER